MISLSEAVRNAKKFLEEGCGVSIYWCTLQEAKVYENKWTIKFHYKLLTSEEYYTIELDAETGDIVGYKREVIR